MFSLHSLGCQGHSKKSKNNKSVDNKLNTVEPPVSDHARLSGRLWEVVVYKNRTTGSLFLEEVQAHLLYGR